MLWDTHMHTHHSGDSDALMPDMIQAAVRQNLDGICFTDHFDYDYPDDPNLFLPAMTVFPFVSESKSVCSPTSRKSTAKR